MCWLCEGLIVLESTHIITLGSPLLVLGLKDMGNFCPTLAELGVTALLFGRHGVQALLARFLYWRLSVSWHIIVLALPLVMGISALGLAAVLRRATVGLGSIGDRRPAPFRSGPPGRCCGSSG